MVSIITLIKKVLQRLKVIDDFVVEQGTSSGGWLYRKWNSGIAECWYLYVGTISPYAHSSVGLGNDFSKVINLPFTFTKIMTLNITASVGSGYSYPFINQNVTDENAKSIIIYWSSNTTGQSRVPIYVAGKWK